MSDPRDASGYSATDLISMGFITRRASRARRGDEARLEIDVARFDAIVVAGGQAPMFSFEQATDLHEKFVAFYEAGKVACALCHGVALLRYARLSNGELLVKGKTVTGFANVEEDFADNAVWGMGALPKGQAPHAVAHRGRARASSAPTSCRRACGAWASRFRDGNLITGQQNFSGHRDREPRHRDPGALSGLRFGCRRRESRSRR
jgi:putative intracellular protease/amidase